MDKLNEEAQNDELAGKLWEKSVEWVQLDQEYQI